MPSLRELCGSRVVVDSKDREAARFSPQGPINAGKAPIDTARLCRRCRLLSTLYAPIDARGSSRGSSRYCRLLSTPQAASVNVPDALQRRDSNSSL
ncbi:hypothetical protein N7465_001573 [Penicillium sp. CMV-2018d]|nr:hypothetical protein N7465_001573 [Penicillium sp. CMV-2018d]